MLKRYCPRCKMMSDIFSLVAYPMYSLARILTAVGRIAVYRIQCNLSLFNFP